ncbi:MAG TPA: metallophosphoesterase family protein [Ramlibacter sp.]|uniref:metallophosphoesterase family protein n=1 Tax=Ramlibacter sp. TaxID=1917967 RepID=UPI002C988466|nr:metallophosphoesterase family protein [Ramlibacter sp.]HVZ44135.1 metallophosphoesterase family protein [Ramlibacter sp.]
MKLALLSDLHANERALKACLAHAQAAGATRFAFLGDLVGYGAEPAAVVDQVIALHAEGAPVVLGNHDRAALRPPAQVADAEAQSAAWTHEHLTAVQRQFLAALPLTATMDDALLVHASAHEPQRWTYIDNGVQVQRCLTAAETQHAARLVFCGHVHEQRLYYRGRAGSPMAFEPAEGVPVPLASHRRWLALVGSVGQPRDGDPRAMYALFDAAQVRIAFHRVAYDHLGAAAAIRRAGLPEAFAQRLELGQ